MFEQEKRSRGDERNIHQPNLASEKKSRNILVIAMFAYFLVIILNGGGLWPFNINTMFSQAGKPWTRPLLRDVTSVADSLIWRKCSLESLPGKPIALQNLGIEQSDFAGFIKKIEELGLEKRPAMQKFFGDWPHPGERWLIMLVIGELTDSGDVHIRAEPYLVLSHGQAKSSLDLLSWKH